MKSLGGRVVVTALVLLMALALAALSAGRLSLALGPKATEPESTVGALGWGEEGIKEVGVSWINDFPGTADDRDHWDESCDGLYYKLLGEGWTGAFRYTNWSAYEDDYKDEARSGHEDSQADRADLAMLCTHGSSAWDSFWNMNHSSVYFGSSVDDQDLVPGDAYNAYGDQDLEWLCFDSCSVLRDSSKAYWAATMNGLHLLLGFKNTMYVIATGDGSRWADYMLGQKFLWWWIRSPYTVKSAWFEAVDDLQPGGVCARVLAEEDYHYNDYVHGRGTVGADYVDGDYFWWDHCSCTPPPLALGGSVLDQITEMPVYEVVDRQVDEDYVLKIGASFGMSTTTVYSDTAFYYMIDGNGVTTYTLQVDRTTGGYKYRNQSELWAAPDEPPTLPLAPEALAIGNRFFAGAGQNLPAAAYRTGEVLSSVEEIVETSKLNPSVGILAEEELGRTPVNVMLSYGRVLEPEVTLASGLKQGQTISVVGPGARTKMYLGDMGEILGVQGGSRDLATTGEQVTIMDADKAWDLYLADPSIALAEVPWVADVISRTAQTLGYYEQPHMMGQGALIPAWCFTASFYQKDALLAEGVLVYVPAAEAYLPPDVSIDAPAAGATYRAGQPVTLTGSVIKHGTPPFEYAWSSSRDGVLGSGASITAALTAEIRSGAIAAHTITLQVTDANSQVGTAEITILVQPTLILPLLLRG